jgi:hypothetical protein
MSTFKYTAIVNDKQEFRVFKEDMPEDLNIVQNDFNELLKDINLRGFNHNYQNQIETNPIFLENLDIRTEQKEIKIKNDDLITRNLIIKISFDLNNNNTKELYNFINNIFEEDIGDFDWMNSTMENRIAVIERMIELLLYGTNKAPGNYASPLDNLQELEIIEQ